jgi:hypothetical protein
MWIHLKLHTERQPWRGNVKPGILHHHQLFILSVDKKKQKNEQEKPKKGVQSFGRQNGKSKIIFSRYDSRDKLVKQKSRRQK